MLKNVVMAAAVIVAFALTACTNTRAHTSEPPRAETPILFVIHYAPGPNWLSGRPLSEQGLERHGAYMRELAAQGELLVAGPLSTSEGGLVILRADTLSAATARMQADPAVQEGKFIGAVSEWRPMIDPGGRFANRSVP